MPFTMSFAKKSEAMIKVHWIIKLNDIGKMVKLGFLMFGESGMI